MVLRDGGVVLRDGLEGGGGTYKGWGGVVGGGGLKKLGFSWVSLRFREDLS